MQPLVEKFNKVGKFLKETKGELQRVSWPNRQQVIRFTSVVVVTTFIVAIYLGIWDWVLSNGFGLLMAK